MLYKTKDKNDIIYEFALAENPEATLIWLWGFPGYPKESELSKYLNSKGISICFPHYIGSWLSAGKFSPKNCNKTTELALEFIKKGKAEELYNNQEISWPTENISIAGGSFGGYWALKAAESMEISKYLLLAPFVDIKNQNTNGDEEDVSKTLDFARKAMAKVYKGVEDRVWDEFFKGEVEEIEYTKIEDKDILIIHGKEDRSVKICHSKRLKKDLEKNNHVELIEVSADHGIHQSVDQELYRRITKYILELNKKDRKE